MQAQHKIQIKQKLCKKLLALLRHLAKLNLSSDIIFKKNVFSYEPYDKKSKFQILLIKYYDYL